MLNYQRVLLFTIGFSHEKMTESVYIFSTVPRPSPLEVAASITAGTRRKRPHFLAFFRGEWRWEDDGKLMENDEKLMENDETPLEMRIWKSEISPLGRLSGFQVQSRRILELWIQWRQTEITTASQRVNVNGSCNWTPLHIKILYASKLWDTWHAKLFQGLHQQ